MDLKGLLSPTPGIQCPNNLQTYPLPEEIYSSHLKEDMDLSSEHYQVMIKCFKELANLCLPEPLSSVHMLLKVTMCTWKEKISNISKKSIELLEEEESQFAALVKKVGLEFTQCFSGVYRLLDNEPNPLLLELGIQECECQIAPEVLKNILEVRRARTKEELFKAEESLFHKIKAEPHKSFARTSYLIECLKLNLLDASDLAFIAKQIELIEDEGFKDIAKEHTIDYLANHRIEAFVEYAENLLPSEYYLELLSKMSSDNQNGNNSNSSEQYG